MLKKILPLLVLAALLVPAAAQAKKIQVEGPASLQGHGPVRGGFRGEEAATVAFRFRMAKIRVTGKAGDLKVECEGERVKKLERTNRRGLTVVLCKGRALAVSVTATRFRFGAMARGAWAISVPDGMNGVVFSKSRRGGDKEKAKPERPADKDAPADEAPADEAGSGEETEESSDS